MEKTDILSFDEIYHLKYKDIYHYCYYNMKYNKCDAEDIANDVFVVFYEIWNDFNPKNELTVSKWLYKTAYNMVLNHNKRKHYYVNTVDYDDAVSEVSTDQIDILSTNNVAEWENSENFRQRIIEIKRYLSHTQYEIFYFSIINGYSNSEIARILDMKENTVKVSLHRIRSKLKKSLKE